MRKRLRKKYHLKEFAEHGFRVDARLNLANEDDCDEFIWGFISFLELLDAYCAITVHDGKARICVHFSARSDGTRIREAVTDWLEGTPFVEDVISVSEIYDAHYYDPVENRRLPLRIRGHWAEIRSNRKEIARVLNELPKLKKRERLASR